MRITASCALGLLIAGGCGEGFLSPKWGSGQNGANVDEGFVESPIDGLADSLALRDTVSEHGWLEGLRLMRVRGYGVVAGLGTRGSRECPREIRERLIQEMYKRADFTGSGLTPFPISPAQILDDLDTAVVLIEGDIPAAAQKGTRFDVKVWALPGTQTTSLEGGRLYTADLHLYRPVSSTGAIEGKALATASGPVFVKPFGAEADAATQRATREGIVIGGGVAAEARRLRFVMNRPSYRTVRRITDVINARFPEGQKIAEATSPSYISLRVPAGFQEDPFHFLALVRHLYLPDRTGFVDKRAEELSEEILAETAPHADIGLAWEGIGRTVLPAVQRLYTNERPYARFHAAMAGLRLGDDVAVDVIGEFAARPESPHRLAAIEELGRADWSTRSAAILRRLLDDADPRVRVDAYEALLARNDWSIKTTQVGGDDFALDRVTSAGENLLYVRRTGSRRIALLGSTVQCTPPLLYLDPNGALTITADEGATSLTLIRRTPYGGATSPPLPASTDVGELIEMLGDDPKVTGSSEVHGLAVGYSTITHALYELCRTRSINAKFMLQAASVTEMFGPVSEGGRRETDL